MSGMVLIATLQERLGVTLRFVDLLEAPTLDEFCGRLDGSPAVVVARRKRRSSAPMTSLQLYGWKQRNKQPDAADLYWLYRISGRLNVDALSGAVDELINRHEILRTTFRRYHGRARQVVQPWTPGALRVLDFSGGTKRVREVDALQQLVDEDYKSFDYKRGPLIRPTLVVLDPHTYLFSLACSEMVLDGTSRFTVATEVSTLYDLLDSGEGVGSLPVPSLQFGDIAVARRKLVGRRQMIAQALYWNQQASKADLLVELPGARQATSGVARRTIELSPGFADRVALTARAFGATSFSVLAAAFTALLAALRPTDQVAYVTTVTHRDLPGADQVIGPFYNNVLVIVPTGEVRDATDLVSATTAATRESFRRSDAPWQHIVSLLQPPKDGRLGIPVHSIRFQFNDYPGEMRFGNLRAQRLYLPITGGVDLAILTSTTASGGLEVTLLHSDAVPRKVADGMLPAYRQILSLLAGDPYASYEDILRCGRRDGRAKVGR